MHVGTAQCGLFRRRRWLLLPLAVLAIAGCGGDDDGSGAPAGSLLVFAASSLTEVIDDLAAEFEASHPGVDVEVNLAASSSLREQILAGAPADVLASASLDVVDPLRAEGELTGPEEVFASNSLVIAVPAGNPAGVSGLDSFADESLLLGACAPGVPCGDLAASAFAQAGIDPALDTEEPNVRALLAKVASADLDAGLVYATDVHAFEESVEQIPLPVGIDASSDYPAVVIDGAPNETVAAAFVEFLVSPEGRAVLSDHGFGLP